MQSFKGRGYTYKLDADGYYNSEDGNIIEIEIYEVPKSDQNPKGDLYVLKYRGEELGRYIEGDHLFKALERKFPSQTFDIPSFRWEWK